MTVRGFFKPITLVLLIVFLFLLCLNSIKDVGIRISTNNPNLHLSRQILQDGRSSQAGNGPDVLQKKSVPQNSENGQNVSLQASQKLISTKARLWSHYSFILRLINKIPHEKWTREFDRYDFYFQDRGDAWFDLISQNKELFTETDLEIVREIKEGWKARLPSALVIGCKKCGTTQFMRYISTHSRIAIAMPEIHFFDKDVKYQRGLDFYKDNMPLSFEDQIQVEKSPKYWVTPGVPERIYHFNPKVKLILLVRNPVYRAISDFYHEKRVERLSNATNFNEYVMQSNGKINRTRNILTPSYYDKHILRWLKVFPRKQIHIIKNEDLVENPHAILLEVEDYLDINNEFKWDFYYNAKQRQVCLLDLSMFGNVQCYYSHFRKESEEVSEDVFDMLKQEFKPHMERFYEIVGRNFSWF